MNIKIKIIVFHVFIWFMLITLPLLLNGQALSGIRPGENSFIYKPFIFFNILMIGTFYLNYFIFIPSFLLKKRYIEYFLICGILFLFVTELPRIGQIFMGKPFPMERPPFPKNISFNRGRHILTILHTNSFLMYVAVFAASISLRMNSLLNSLQKEKHAAQLSHLKAQVNPHFLFNTLNSIYSISLKTSPQVADMVSRLSEMMRYTMRESQMDYVPLSMEIENLTNYIELQKVRIHDKVDLDFTVNGDVENQQIAPLLLLPFIENAFKHGVNPESDSVIIISITINKSNIHLMVRNTILKVKLKDDEGGLGIENTVNRLNLIYPNNHRLSISEMYETHNVTLEITLK